MIIDQKIESLGATFSPLHDKITLHIEANRAVIETVFDIQNNPQLNAEEVAEYLAECLQAALLQSYHRGGLRRKYE